MTPVLLLPQDTTNPGADALGSASRSPGRMNCQLSKGLEFETFNPIEVQGAAITVLSKELGDYISLTDMVRNFEGGSALIGLRSNRSV